MKAKNPITQIALVPTDEALTLLVALRADGTLWATRIKSWQDVHEVAGWYELDLPLDRLEQTL
jgi:hypothetical protein